MQDEDRQKIALFKKEFHPSSLPEEVLKSGNYKTGTEILMRQ
jgi:hypothetical protein